MRPTLEHPAKSVNKLVLSDFSRCRDSALDYLHAGYSLIPVKLDASKQPKIRWAEYQRRRPTEKEVNNWFASPAAIGIVCGSVSGNLEVLDFDDASAFIAFSELLDDHAPGLFERLPVIATPSGGRHMLYRCAEIEGSRKLAMRAVKVQEGTDGARFDGVGWIKLRTLIETRGEGGYIIAPSSPPKVHPSGKAYQILDGDILNPPSLNPDMRMLLLGLACALNEHFPHEKVVGVLEQNPKNIDGLRPGDDFALKASWSNVLEPHGWRCVKARQGVAYWKRPGVSEKPYHATTGFGGRDTLYVFTTSTEFAAGLSYTKFGAYTILNHAGDFKASARVLADEGYGEQGQLGTCEDEGDNDDPDPPIAEDPKRERRLRAMAADAASVIDVIMQLLSVLGVKGNHTRIVNALVAVAGGRLTTFVATHSVLHHRGYELIKPAWADSAERIKTGRVSRDIAHFIDALEAANLVVRLPNGCEGLVNYRPGTMNMATGVGLGSRFRFNFLRHALSAIDYSLIHRGDFKFAYQAREAGVAHVAKAVHRYHIPSVSGQEQESEQGKLLKASRKAKAALRKLSVVAVQCGKKPDAIEQAAAIVERAVETFVAESQAREGGCHE
jgi:hypothetical protein